MEVCIKRRWEQAFASLLHKAAQEGAIERGLTNHTMREPTWKCSSQVPWVLTLPERAD